MTRKIRYGGHHNPEQWPEPVRDEDHRLFTRAGMPRPGPPHRPTLDPLGAAILRVR